MDVNYEIVNENLQECWEYYYEYRENFFKENYSDTKIQDFLDWCFDNLYQCPNCGDIVLKDEQSRLWDQLNADNVCDDCIECGGYYE